MTETPSPTATSRSEDGRYPRTPVPAVLAVVPRGGRLVLVRRANPPDPGKWGFPGGRLELGESLAEAALRELREETGITAEAGPAIWSGDVIDRDVTGAVRYHYVLTAVLCRWSAGEPVAASDAAEVAWMDAAEIAALPNDALSRDVAPLARLALGIARRLGW